MTIGQSFILIFGIFLCVFGFLSYIKYLVEFIVNKESKNSMFEVVCLFMGISLIVFSRLL